MADSQPLERTSFHTGQLLTAEDLAREQDYFRDKQKRHNRTLHGFGVVSGLKVTITGGRVVVDPGLALDCEGNEIVIGTQQQLTPLAATAGSRAVYVNIRYTDELCEKTVRESFEICFGDENFNRGHRHLRARWLACDKAHPLTIAKLRCSLQGWRVDRRFRAPVIK